MHDKTASPREEFTDAQIQDALKFGTGGHTRWGVDWVDEAGDTLSGVHYTETSSVDWDKGIHSGTVSTEGGLTIQTIDPEMKLFEALKGPAGLSAIERDGDDYKLIMPLPQSKYWVVDLWKPPGASWGAHLVHQLGASFVSRYGLSVLVTEGVITGGAHNWHTAGGTNAQAYGGKYRWTVTPGDVTWTSPKATFVGLRHLASSNGGVGRVSIDGDATRATLLPTAQDLVTAGTLASSVLVANGGTLNPTDRVLDYYQGSTDWDRATIFADDLASGTHEVLLEWTGEVRAAATASRVYASGWVSGPEAGNAELIPEAQIHWPYSAWEYATDFTPKVGSTRHFIGCIHGFETQDSLQVLVDNAVVALVDGERVWGDSIDVIKATTQRHPESHGDTSTTLSLYRVSDQGLRVGTDTTWLEDGEVKAAYAAMMSVIERMNRGRSARGATVTMDQDTSDRVSISRSLAGAAWDDKFAVGFKAESIESVQNWVNSAPGLTSFQDRVGGDMNKMYVARVGNAATPEVIKFGDYWKSDVTHRVAILADPEAVLG